MRSGREEASPVRIPGVMPRPVLSERHRQSVFRIDAPVLPSVRCISRIGARVPVRHALVAVVMAVAALCGGNRAHAQQETSSSRSFIPSSSEQPTPFSDVSLPSVIQTSSPADTVHFCLPADLEQLEHGRPILAGKRQGDLNVGEPRTVRMIYFLPNDREYRSSIVDSMKTVIKQVQTFYAEQMRAHGYGDKAFRFETDAQGEPLVHQVGGQHPDRYYYDTSGSTIIAEIGDVFDIHSNIYSIIMDSEHRLLNGRGGGGTPDGKNGGYAWLLNVYIGIGSSLLGGFSGVLAHELGHAFGLQHDFNDGAYIMSYGSGGLLSACSAEFLAVHPYFSPDISTKDGRSQDIKLVSSSTYPGDLESVPVRFKVSDPEGLHQAVLFVRTIAPHSAAGFLEVKACRGLSGVQNDVIEFDYDGAIPSADSTSLSDTPLHAIYVGATDTDGNMGGKIILLSQISPNHIATEELPAEVVLLGNYPNPFNPETTIGYALPRAGKVRLVVYDLLGHEVTVLVDGSQPAGRYAVRFRGDHLPSGPYAYRLQAGDEVVVRTMILVK